MKSKNLLLIFTRNPELGKVKSRLAADIGDKAALNVYTFLLEHTFNVTKNLSVDKQVWYSEMVPEKDLWNNGNYIKNQQIGNDLGERMHNAFLQGFEKGYQNIIIIGSDLYDINTQDLEQAFICLQKNEAIIGPATDGGFYLLGLSKNIPEVFKNKEWGTNSVLQNTLNNLKKYTFEQLSAKNDVDYLSDIQHIKAFKPFINSNIND